MRLNEQELQPKDITDCDESELFAILNELLWEFTNNKARWEPTSRLAYSECDGWNKVVRDEFGTKCFKLAFGMNGGRFTTENQWKLYLEDISDFIVEYEQRVKEVFGDQANVWIINIVFDVCDDVYDLVCGVGVGEEFDEKESDSWQEQHTPPSESHPDSMTSEEQISHEIALGSEYDKEMDPFTKGWLH